MIDQSDYVVTYVHSPIGGAAKFKALAERKGKTVVEIADGNLHSDESSCIIEKL